MERVSLFFFTAKFPATGTRYLKFGLFPVGSRLCTTRLVPFVLGNGLLIFLRPNASVHSSTRTLFDLCFVLKRRPIWPIESVDVAESARFRNFGCNNAILDRYSSVQVK